MYIHAYTHVDETTHPAFLIRSERARARARERQSQGERVRDGTLHDTPRFKKVESERDNEDVFMLGNSLRNSEESVFVTCVSLSLTHTFVKKFPIRP